MARKKVSQDPGREPGRVVPFPPINPLTGRPKERIHLRSGRIYELPSEDLALDFAVVYANEPEKPVEACRICGGKPIFGQYATCRDCGEIFSEMNNRFWDRVMMGGPSWGTLRYRLFKEVLIERGLMRDEKAEVAVLTRKRRGVRKACKQAGILIVVVLPSMFSSFAQSNTPSTEQRVLLGIRESGHAVSLWLENEMDMTVTPWQERVVFCVRVTPPRNWNQLSWEGRGTSLEAMVEDLLRRILDYLAAAGPVLPPSAPQEKRGGEE